MPKNNRYIQLTTTQRKAVVAEKAPVSIHPAFGSFTGPEKNLSVFLESLKLFKSLVHGWLLATALTVAFVTWSSSPKRKSKTTYLAAVRRLNHGFFKYIRNENLTTISLSDVNSEFLSQFLAWLKKPRENGSPLAVNTQRKLYGATTALLEILMKLDEYKPLTRNLIIPQGVFPDSQSTTVPTAVIDDISYQRLYAACSAEVRRIRENVQMNKKILSEGFSPHDSLYKKSKLEDGMLQYKLILDEYLFVYGLAPTAQSLRISHPKFYKEFAKEKGFLRKISFCFFPIPSDLIPFIILLAIYSQANSSGIFGITKKDVLSMSVLGQERVVLHIKKNRGGGYNRSFATEPDDPISPGELIKFLLSWSGRIKNFARNYKDRIFLFVARDSVLRSFNVAADDGVSSDFAWAYNLKIFLAEHDLPTLSISNIRITGLDRIMILNDDDVYAAMRAGGQKTVAVMETHYDSDAARLRRQEDLSHTMNAFGRWVSTAGAIEPRGMPDSSDFLSATPGFHCMDPYSSPMPGEIHGRQCQAFGGCPMCPHGFVDRRSAYAFARCLQLKEAVLEAKEYLPSGRWHTYWFPVLVRLNEVFLPCFGTDLSAEASTYDLNDLGELE